MRAKKKKDPITLGKGEGSAKQEKDSPVTKRPSGQGKDSDGDVSAPPAFGRLNVNNVISSFIPRPSPLVRDICFKNSAKSCIKESQIAFRSSYKRNAIASSYSSTLAQWPPERISARGTRAAVPGAASGAATGAAARACATRGAAPGAALCIAAGATQGAAPGADSWAATGATVHATRGAAPDAAAGATSGAASGAAADALPLPSSDSSQSKGAPKKGSEEGPEVSDNPKKKEKKKKKKKDKKAAITDASQVDQEDLWDSFLWSDFPKPVRRKIPLLLPHRRDVPLILPPTPRLCFRITEEDFDLEKKTAMQWINKVLEGMWKAAWSAIPPSFSVLHYVYCRNFLQHLPFQSHHLLRAEEL
ncbi:hypothetical protein STEG23_007409 [Scotinomys teguina]